MCCYNCLFNNKFYERNIIPPRPQKHKYLNITINKQLHSKAEYNQLKCHYYAH